MRADLESEGLVAKIRPLSWFAVALAVAPGAIVQGLVAAVQAVTFGSLLLPGETSELTCTLGWMWAVVAGQIAAAALSRLPCAVA